MELYKIQQQTKQKLAEEQTKQAEEQTKQKLVEEQTKQKLAEEQTKQIQARERRSQDNRTGQLILLYFIVFSFISLRETEKRVC